MSKGARRASAITPAMSKTTNPSSERQPAQSLGIDAYKPAEIAERIERAGVAKANLPLVPMLTLAILAGLFIAFGAMLYTVVMTAHGLGYGPSRLLGGLAFCLGLILVVIAGAELFTGNTLIVMARIDGLIATKALLRNWGIVFAGNFAGALLAAILILLSGTLDAANGQVWQTAASIAQGKVALPWLAAFTRAILCNALVCLAIWLTFAAHDIAGKILAILFPITAFVALGFEHSIANMYFLAVALTGGAEGVTLTASMANLAIVTLGNIVGGAGGVGLTYWVCYKSGARGF